MTRLIIILLILTSVNVNTYSSEFERAKDTIELRQAVMQGIWARVKRLVHSLNSIIHLSIMSSLQNRMHKT